MRGFGCANQQCSFLIFRSSTVRWTSINYKALSGTSFLTRPTLPTPRQTGRSTPPCPIPWRGDAPPTSPTMLLSLPVTRYLLELSLDRTLGESFRFPLTSIRAMLKFTWSGGTKYPMQWTEQFQRTLIGWNVFHLPPQQRTLMSWLISTSTAYTTWPLNRFLPQRSSSSGTARSTLTALRNQSNLQKQWG